MHNNLAGTMTLKRKTLAPIITNQHQTKNYVTALFLRLVCFLAHVIILLHLIYNLENPTPS